MRDEDMPWWLNGTAGLMGVAIELYGLWCTAIAFMGGTLPLLGVHLTGGLATGLAFLFMGEPIVITLAYWATMLVLLPLTVLALRLARRR